MSGIGLVLEGGGMRGVYTSGVLDYFMEQNFYVPYVIGVSAGACNGVSYVSRQPGRTKKATIGYIDDPRYINYKNLIRHGYLLNMDLIFDEFPNKLIPFHYDTFFDSEQECVIAATNCSTGLPEYFCKKDGMDITNIMDICRASSSMPFVSPIIKIGDKPFLDGGITDSIPIKKSIEDGNDKNIIVLTRNKGYHKKPSSLRFLVKKVYAEYPGLQEAIFNRYKMYNETLELIDKLEKEGRVFVIRPSVPVTVGRAEKNAWKLTELYDMGYKDAENSMEALKEWLDKEAPAIIA